MENKRVIFQNEFKENENEAKNIQKIANAITYLKFEETCACTERECLSKSIEKEKSLSTLLNCERKMKEDKLKSKDVRFYNEEVMSTMSKKSTETDILSASEVSSLFLHNCREKSSFNENIYVLHTFPCMDRKLATNEVEAKVLNNFFLSNCYKEDEETCLRKEVMRKMKIAEEEKSRNDKNNVSVKCNNVILSNYNIHSNSVVADNLSHSGCEIKDKIEGNTNLYFCSNNYDKITTKKVQEINCLQNINVADEDMYLLFPSSNNSLSSKLKKVNNRTNVTAVGSVCNAKLLNNCCKGEMSYCKDVEYHEKDKSRNVVLKNDSVSVCSSLMSNKQNWLYFSKEKNEGSQKALSATLKKERIENKVDIQKYQSKSKADDIDKRQKIVNNVKEKIAKRKEETLNKEEELVLEVCSAELEEDDDSIISRIINKVLEESDYYELSTKEKAENLAVDNGILTESAKSNTLKTEKLRKILIKIVDELLMNENVAEVNVAQILQKILKKKQIDFSDLIFPSLGALLHHQGFCKPCVFANKNKKTCHNAACCYFCHFYHKEKRRRNKKNKAKENTSYSFFPPPPPSKSPAINSFFLTNCGAAAQTCPPPPPSFEDSCFSSVSHSALFDNLPNNCSYADSVVRGHPGLCSAKNHSFQSKASWCDSLNASFVNNNSDNDCTANRFTHLQSNTPETSNSSESRGFTSLRLNSSNQVPLLSSAEKGKENLEQNLFSFINDLKKKEDTLTLCNHSQFENEKKPFFSFASSSHTEVVTNKTHLSDMKAKPPTQVSFTQNCNVLNEAVENQEYDKIAQVVHTDKTNPNSVFTALKDLSQNELLTILKFVESVVQQKKSEKDAENAYITDASEVSLKKDSNVHLEDLLYSSCFPCESEVSCTRNNLASSFSCLVSCSIASNSAENESCIASVNEKVSSDVYNVDYSKMINKLKHKEAKNDYALENSVACLIDDDTLEEEEEKNVDSNLSFHSNFSESYSLPSLFCSLHNKDDTSFFCRKEDTEEMSVVKHNNELCQKESSDLSASCFSLKSSFFFLEESHDSDINNAGKLCKDSTVLQKMKHVVSETVNKDDTLEKLYAEENASLFVNLFSSYSTSSTTVVSAACDVSTNNDAFSNNSDSNDICNNIENKTNDSSLSCLYDEKLANISSLSDCSSVAFGKIHAFPSLSEEEKKITVLDSDLSYSFNELEDEERNKSEDSRADAFVFSEDRKKALEKARKTKCIARNSCSDCNSSTRACADEQCNEFFCVCGVHCCNSNCCLNCCSSDACSTNDLIKSFMTRSFLDVDNHGEAANLCPSNSAARGVLSNASFFEPSSLLGVAASAAATATITAAATTAADYKKSDKTAELCRSEANPFEHNFKLSREERDFCSRNNNNCCSCCVLLENPHDNHFAVNDDARMANSDRETESLFTSFSNYFNCCFNSSNQSNNNSNNQSNNNNNHSNNNNNHNNSNNHSNSNNQSNNNNHNNSNNQSNNNNHNNSNNHSNNNNNHSSFSDMCCSNSYVDGAHYFNNYLYDKNNRMYVIKAEDILLDTASEIYALKMLNDVATAIAYSTLVDVPSNVSSASVSSSSNLLQTNSNVINNTAVNKCIKNANCESDFAYYGLNKNDISFDCCHVFNRNFSCNNTENNSIKALLNFKKLGHLW